MTKTTKTSVDNNAETLTALAALLGIAQPAAKTETAKPAKLTKEERDAQRDERRYYDDVVGTERNIQGEPPAELLAELESVRSDKNIGENQRTRLIASITQEIKDRTQGAKFVLQRMRAEKVKPGWKHLVRVQIVDGDCKVEIKPHELAPILRHARELASWLGEMARGGKLD